VIIVGKAEVVLPPGGFLQATVAGEEALAARVLAACARSTNVIDLFCGVGPFALRLAERARVQACDLEAPAIAALGKAAQATRGLKPVRAEVRDLFRGPLTAAELRDADAVIFDPPRQGALAQAQQLAASRVPLVVAVSCNPATFARDARLLIDGGYRIGQVEPIDQFRHTPHVELVARFTR
jgi:23S rRNA (uracil1939-C5)-methyltransferase